MREFVRLVEFLNGYVQALETGIEKFTKALPILTKQHVNTTAKRKLNSTYEHYMENVSVKMNNYLLVVEINKDDWLSNAVESGIGQFDMKDGFFKSPKAKLSKKGYRYLRIPIGVKKTASVYKGTEKGRQMQQKINAVLNQTKVGITKLQTLMGGKVQETQQILTNDPDLGGLYRTRQFENADAYHSGKSKPSWQYVLFRTVSENPESKTAGGWQHPGIKPAYILKNTERWLQNSLEPMLESYIEHELKAMQQKLGE